MSPLLTHLLTRTWSSEPDMIPTTPPKLQFACTSEPLNRRFPLLTQSVTSPVVRPTRHPTSVSLPYAEKLTSALLTQLETIPLFTATSAPHVPDGLENWQDLSNTRLQISPSELQKRLLPSRTRFLSLKPCPSNLPLNSSGNSENSTPERSMSFFSVKTSLVPDCAAISSMKRWNCSSSLISGLKSGLKGVTISEATEYSLHSISFVPLSSSTTTLLYALTRTS